MVKQYVPWFLCSIMTVSVAHAELRSLDDEELETATAQTGLLIDIDVSDLELTYSYQNNQNPNENFWIAGTDPGGDIIRFNGITVDVVSLPGGSNAGGLAIGLPETIQLSNVNTGDYYIAHPNPADPDSPPRIDTDLSDGVSPGSLSVAEQRKLFGLRWNSNIGINFPEAAAAAVEAETFANDLIRTTGTVTIFGIN